MRKSTWLAAALFGLAAACDTMSPTEPGALVPRTVTEDASLPAIEMNGARFHVQTFGNPANPPIVFLHGGPGGDYRSLLRLSEAQNGRSLADDYFLIYWDQRGSGLSQRVGKDQLTTDVFVSDLNALIDHYAPGRRVFLIGESWGGMFATRYIDQYPRRVAGAVLIEPGPLDGATMERLKGDIQSIDLGSEWLNDYAWSSQFLSPDDHARMDYELMLGVRDAEPRFHEDKEHPSPMWRLGAAANRYLMKSGQNAKGVFAYDFTAHLSAFTTPVLFVAGAWSEVLGPSLQRQQVLRYPSASLTVVDGAGHDAAWVKSAEVITLIRAYLDARKGDAQ